MRKGLARNLLILCGLVTLVAVNIGPLAWGILASLKPQTQLVTYPPRVFGFTPTLENYRRVFESGFALGIRNTFCYAFASMSLGVLLGSLAAFGFDRFNFRYRGGLMTLMIASIPLASGAAAMIVPNYLYFTYLGLTNQWFTLPLIYSVYTLPMATWIIKGSMEGIPRDLDEAAYVDGASSLTVFFRITLPLCKPGLGATGLFLFMHAWNEFIAGSVMVDAKELKPIQVLVYQFIGFFGRDWGPLTASATLAMLPVIIIYGLFGRLLISGLTRGAVKG